MLEEASISTTPCIKLSRQTGDKLAWVSKKGEVLRCGLELIFVVEGGLQASMADRDKRRPRKRPLPDSHQNDSADSHSASANRGQQQLQEGGATLSSLFLNDTLTSSTSPPAYAPASATGISAGGIPPTFHAQDDVPENIMRLQSMLQSSQNQQHPTLNRHARNTDESESAARTSTDLLLENLSRHSSPHQQGMQAAIAANPSISGHFEGNVDDQFTRESQDMLLSLLLSSQQPAGLTHQATSSIGMGARHQQSQQGVDVLFNRILGASSNQHAQNQGYQENDLLAQLTNLQRAQVIEQLLGRVQQNNSSNTSIASPPRSQPFSSQGATDNAFGGSILENFLATSNVSLNARRFPYEFSSMGSRVCALSILGRDIASFCFHVTAAEFVELGAGVLAATSKAATASTPSCNPRFNTPAITAACSRLHSQLNTSR